MSLIIIATNLLMVLLIFLTGQMFSARWHDLLDGKPLPGFTVMSMRYGFIVPTIGSAFLIFQFVSTANSNCANNKTGALLAACILIIELIFLVLIVGGYLLPYLYTGEGMG